MEHIVNYTNLSNSTYHKYNNTLVISRYCVISDISHHKHDDRQRKEEKTVKCYALAVNVPGYNSKYTNVCLEMAFARLTRSGT